ncbi:MAG TPA: cellulose synthase family protein [Sphingobacteriaceae bacterium]|nr:cellulose synthase family protein [Sphingobacteriaceae bacterium]
MIEVFVNIIVLLYSFAILFVFIHSLFDAHLIYHYLISSKKKKQVVYSKDFIPFVTIQLPVYNELYVVERLIDAVAVIDYPRDKLEIQILDDSTDETSGIIADKVTLLQQQNISIQHIQRKNRKGFKAGALKHGLDLAKGEFLAVFDADFLPSKDFLKRTIPFFKEATIGMVQTKWGHINKDTSLLANLQSIALDGHFSIEQQGRNAAGYFINFNGTAGVWRKRTILDAGNWQSDTLTEDLDLSYRAQMKGWKFTYLEDFNTPAELPPFVSALKSQQFRWTKGGAETARKNMRSLFASKLSLSVKLHGAFHLIYSFGFISVITNALLAVPLLFVKEFYPDYNLLFKISSFICISFFIYILHYFISYLNNTSGSLMQKVIGFILRFPLFVSLFIGLSLNNAIGIMQGYFGIKSGFIRTPKFNAGDQTKKIITGKYIQPKINWLNITEGVLILYFSFGVIQAIFFENYASLPLLLMALTGFSMMFILSIKEWRQKSLAAIHE